MARQIVWSLKAQKDRKEILMYWNQRNKSLEYSRKLNRLFKKAVNLISEYPEIGKLTNDKNARIKIVHNYLMIYEYNENQVLILNIWDGRQNPKKLKINQ